MSVDASKSGLNLGVVLRQISFGDGVGGMERAAALHIEQMVANGVRVTLYTPGRFLRGSLPQGVTHVDVPWPIWNGGPGIPTFGIAYFLWVRSLARILNRDASAHDVLHLHGGSAGVLRYLNSSSPSVANPHGMEEFERSSIARLPNRIFTRWLGRGGRGATRVIATDASLVAAVISNIGIAESQVCVIPNSVDVQSLTDMTSDREPGDAFNIVSIGRLVRNKGYDLLLDALAQPTVRESLPSGWRWIHFGSGPDAETLKSRASAHQLPLDIRAGRTDAEVQGQLSRADLFVQPSRHEGSSLTTLEAMAHGIRVVGTPVGGIPDKIADGRTGYLAAEASVDALASALVRALASTEPVGSRARELVVDRFSVAATTGAYLRLYESIAMGATRS